MISMDLESNSLAIFATKAGEFLTSLESIMVTIF